MPLSRRPVRRRYFKASVVVLPSTPHAERRPTPNTATSCANSSPTTYISFRDFDDIQIVVRAEGGGDGAAESAPAFSLTNYTAFAPGITMPAVNLTRILSEAVRISSVGIWISPVGI